MGLADSQRDDAPAPAPAPAEAKAKDDARASAAAREDGPLFFDALLMPHRSLSPRGFLIIMALLAGVSFIAGMVFVSVGAWPVFGFFGLDVLLVYIAFRANYRSARHSERVALTKDALTVERVDIYGKRSLVSFEPSWLRIEIDDPPAHDSPLVLASHGRRLAIAGFLSPEERLHLAGELRAGLSAWRAALTARSQGT
jgi:uncharacterized membrane protein